MDKMLRSMVMVAVMVSLLSLSMPAYADTSDWIPTYATDDVPSDVTSDVSASDDTVAQIFMDEYITVWNWNESMHPNDYYNYVLAKIELDNVLTGRTILFSANHTGSFVSCTECTQSAVEIGTYSCNLTSGCGVDTVSELNSLAIRITISGTFSPPTTFSDIDYIYLEVEYPPYVMPTIDFIAPTDIDHANVSRDYTYINISTPTFRRDTLTLDWNSTNETFTQDYINKTGLADSIYTYQACVNNTIGWTNCTETRTLTVDTVNPNMTVLTMNNVTYNQTALTFKVSASDLNLYGCWYDLDSAGYLNLPYNITEDTYRKEVSPISQGSHSLVYICNDTAGNQNVSDTIYFTIDSLSPVAPVNLLPYDTDHTNVNETAFTWTVPFDTIGIDRYQLQISNSSGFEVGNITIDHENIASANYTLQSYEALADGVYYWHARANDTLGNGYGSWSAYFTVVIDTVYPNWVLGQYPAFDNSTVVADSIIWDAKVNDMYLLHALLNVTDVNGTVVHENLTENIDNGTEWFNYSHTTDMSGWADGYYTVELSASDDHTYGDLHGLTYDIKIDGIEFCKGSTCKKIWFGYYLGGEFNFLTSAQVTAYNISAQIYDTGHGEYKFSMAFNRPATDVLFGFAIPDNLMEVRDTSTGHFIWKDWYIDFEDLLGTGFPITYGHMGAYHVVYTSTAYCPVAVDELCILDPVVGGLNIKTEYYLIKVDNSAPVISEIHINATPTTLDDTMVNVTVTDANLDTVLLEYSVDDLNVGGDNVSANHTVTDFSGDEFWHVIDHSEYCSCCVVYYRFYANDTFGHLSASPLQSFAVLNSLPVVTENALSPDTIYVNESLNLTVTCIDVDLDANLTVHWNIYKDSMLVPDLSGSMLIGNNASTYIGTIEAFTFTGDGLVWSDVSCEDHIANGSSVSSDDVTILNTLPELVHVSLTDIGFQLFIDDVAFTYNNIYLNMRCSDADTDNVLTAHWNITRDGAVVDSLSELGFILHDTDTNMATVPAGSTDYGDVWGAVAWCSDDSAGISPASVSGNVTIFTPDTVLTHTKGYDAMSKAGGFMTGIVNNVNLAVMMVIVAMFVVIGIVVFK